MKNRNYNYVYCGFSIVIRANKGRAKLSDRACFEVEGENHENLKNELEHLVREFYSFVIYKDFDLKIDQSVLFGLSQLSREFAISVLNKLETYSKKWSQETRVRFGITGIISEGKPGSPNYQIESLDGKNRRTFDFHGEPFGATHFEERHITIPLSQEDISKIWLLG